jgi:hypothetical protein
VRWRGYVSLPPHRSTDDGGADLNGVDALSDTFTQIIPDTC